MSRTVAIGSFVIFTLLLGGGVIALLQHHPAAPAPPSAAAIVAEAEQRVPRLVLPPPPAGHLVASTQVLERITRVPAPVGANPVAEAPPRLVHHAVPVPTLQGATPAETATWNAAVQTAEANYAAALQQQTERIAAEHAAAPQPSGGSSTIVATIAALTGLIGAIASLITALKSTHSRESA